MKYTTYTLNNSHYPHHCYYTISWQPEGILAVKNLFQLHFGGIWLTHSDTQ